MPDPPLTAAAITRWLTEASDRLHDARDELTALDAARGDADHGANMDRGFGAVARGLAEETFDTPQAVLLQASAMMRRSMGGTSGPLWSMALRRMGQVLGPAPEVDARVLGTALLEAGQGISELGGAAEGDNTMVDVLLPVGRELRDELNAGVSLPVALEHAADRAAELAQATADTASTRGRASYLGARAIGSADPGAISASIVVRALSSSLAVA
jgi:phosphoenolpyruvate---glycerone phosphotransferase subunit DhaL